VTLNGRDLDRSFIRHEKIVSGGELRFRMQATPNRRWATEQSGRPFSTSTGKP
jgi:putative alpha-1,2-mannosidase